MDYKKGKTKKTLSFTMKKGLKPYLETEYHRDHPEYLSDHIEIHINR